MTGEFSGKKETFSISAELVEAFLTKASPMALKFHNGRLKYAA